MSDSAFDDSNPPDWARLRAIAAEVEQLIAAGVWTKPEFDRVYAEGAKAANGHEEFLEGLINEADPAWLASPHGSRGADASRKPIS